MLSPRAAQAGCPSPYDTASCNSVCALTSVSSTNDTWTCDVSASTNKADVTTVEDYDAATPYESWGVYVTGAPGAQTRHNFCCDLSSTDVEDVIIIGSDYGDTLKFESDSRTYNLQPAGSSAIVGYIYGGQGNDALRGSDVVYTRFYEHLYGEEDDDSIIAHDGYHDYSYGGPGNDTMLGGPGPDTMHGGDGGDTMLGGPDSDTMYGEADNDPMAGGADDDYLDGGEGKDVLCGDAGTGDLLLDGDTYADTEKLWGDDSGDMATCLNDATMIGPTTGDVGTSCSSTKLPATRPAECP